MRFMMLSVNGETPELILDNGEGALHRINELYRRAVTSGMALGSMNPDINSIVNSPNSKATVNWLNEHCEDAPVIQDGDKYEYAVPVTEGDIFCIGRNYVEHAKELGNDVPETPVVFMKPRASLIPSGGEIIYPNDSERVDFEGELALIMGRDISGKINEDEAEDAIFGVTLLNDVTDRELQGKLKAKGKPWVMAKGRISFAPCGPCVLVINTLKELDNLKIETYLNNDIKQLGDSTLWVFSAYKLISYLSEEIGLKAGDIISTGTPKGVGPMVKGDIVEVRSPLIGSLINRVI